MPCSIGIKEHNFYSVLYIMCMQLLAAVSASRCSIVAM